MSTSKLFEPIKVGTLELQHRVVLAPLTRVRATKEHVPINPLMETYFTQRASRPGTLLLSDATFIAARAGGINNIPGIWSDDQIAAWKVITDGVHAKGSYMFLQLWALGRTAGAEAIKEEGYDVVAPSPIAVAGKAGLPRELTTSEIHQYIQLYAQAAKKAVHRAGFDGVEIHGANGYLIDQFLQDVSNQRSDEYGGSVENRSRFGLEVAEAVIKEVGQEKTGIRISPWSKVESMGMEDPIPQYTHFVSSIAAKYPNLAYIHAVEPPASSTGKSNDFIRELWAPRPFITCGGYTRERAIERADTKGDLIAFGKLYIANPDLPYRLQKNIPLSSWDSKTFYFGGPVGYIDYPFAEDNEGQAEARL